MMDGNADSLAGESIANPASEIGGRMSTYAQRMDARFSQFGTAQVHGESPLLSAIEHRWAPLARPGGIDVFGVGLLETLGSEWNQIEGYQDYSFDFDGPFVVPVDPVEHVTGLPATSLQRPRRRGRTLRPVAARRPRRTATKAGPSMGAPSPAHDAGPEMTSLAMQPTERWRALDETKLSPYPAAMGKAGAVTAPMLRFPEAVAHVPAQRQAGPRAASRIVADHQAGRAWGIGPSFAPAARGADEMVNFISARLSPTAPKSVSTWLMSADAPQHTVERTRGQTSSRSFGTWMDVDRTWVTALPDTRTAVPDGIELAGRATIGDQADIGRAPTIAAGVSRIEQPVRPLVQRVMAPAPRFGTSASTPGSRSTAIGTSRRNIGQTLSSALRDPATARMRGIRTLTETGPRADLIRNGAGSHHGISAGNQRIGSTRQTQPNMPRSRVDFASQYRNTADRTLVQRGPWNASGQAPGYAPAQSNIAVAQHGVSSGSTSTPRTIPTSATASASQFTTPIVRRITAMSPIFATPQLPSSMGLMRPGLSTSAGHPELGNRASGLLARLSNPVRVFGTQSASGVGDDALDASPGTVGTRVGAPTRSVLPSPGRSVAGLDGSRGSAAPWQEARLSVAPRFAAWNTTDRTLVRPVHILAQPRPAVEATSARAGITATSNRALQAAQVAQLPPMVQRTLANAGQLPNAASPLFTSSTRGSTIDRGADLTRQVPNETVMGQQALRSATLPLFQSTTVEPRPFALTAQQWALEQRRPDLVPWATVQVGATQPSGIQLPAVVRRALGLEPSAHDERRAFPGLGVVGDLLQAENRGLEDVNSAPAGAAAVGLTGTPSDLHPDRAPEMVAQHGRAAPATFGMKAPLEGQALRAAERQSSSPQGLGISMPQTSHSPWAAQEPVLGAQPIQTWINALADRVETPRPVRAQRSTFAAFDLGRGTLLHPVADAIQGPASPGTVLQTTSRKTPRSASRTTDSVREQSAQSRWITSAQIGATGRRSQRMATSIAAGTPQPRGERAQTSRSAGRSRGPHTSSSHRLLDAAHRAVVTPSTGGSSASQPTEASAPERSDEAIYGSPAIARWPANLRRLLTDYDAAGQWVGADFTTSSTSGGAGQLSGLSNFDDPTARAGARALEFPPVDRTVVDPSGAPRAAQAGVGASALASRTSLAKRRLRQPGTLAMAALALEASVRARGLPPALRAAVERSTAGLPAGGPTQSPAGNQTAGFGTLSAQLIEPTQSTAPSTRAALQSARQAMSAARQWQGWQAPPPQITPIPTRAARPLSPVEARMPSFVADWFGPDLVTPAGEAPAGARASASQTSLAPTQLPVFAQPNSVRGSTTSTHSARRRTFDRPSLAPANIDRALVAYEASVQKAGPRARRANLEAPRTLADVTGQLVSPNLPHAPPSKRPVVTPTLTGSLFGDRGPHAIQAPDAGRIMVETGARAAEQALRSTPGERPAQGAETNEQARHRAGGDQVSEELSPEEVERVAQIVSSGLREILEMERLRFGMGEDGWD